METAFAYVRVSSESQKEKKTQENQVRAIKKYCLDKKINISEWFYDLAISGLEPERVGLNEMKQRINEVESIIVFDSSRLSRNFEDSIKLMFFFKERNKKVHFVNEGRAIDANDDMMQLILVIKSWFDSYEYRIAKERRMLGIQRYIEKHGSWGRPKKKINEKKYRMFRKAGVSKSAIARIFEMDRRTLYRRIKELGIEDL